jgi:beta-phosphoglucomutase-like phosphatase (HAD superfamily)
MTDYIPYETEDGVVVAVDLDGTVHRAKPPITDAQVEAAARSNYQFQHRASTSFVPAWEDEHAVWKDAYREEARAALEAARDAS